MKRKIKKRLRGELVLVHPQLTTDPIDKQGQIGKVTAVSGKECDIIRVKFSNGESGNYMSDGLLTLLPKAKILKNIGVNPDLTNGEKWTLLKIVKDVTWGEKAKALERALANTKILNLSTTDFSQLIQVRKNRRGKSKRL